MNITKLQRMIAVYEAGSFRKAAQLLGMSQPALTWSIRQLEEGLNSRLFDRGPRGIQPTAMCEKLISRARLIVREQDRMVADVERSTRHQTIEIGVHSSLLNDALPHAIGRFRDVAPQVSLRIREGYSAGLIEQIQRGELDFAYCALPAQSDDDAFLDMEPITTLDYSVVARHDHPAFADIATGRAIGAYPWAQFDSANIVGAFPGMGNIDRIMDDSGHGIASQLVRTPSMSLIKLLVLAGEHLGLIADAFIGEELASGTLQRLPGARITAAQLGFISLQGGYETLAVRRLKSLLRTIGGEPASAPGMLCESV